MYRGTSRLILLGENGRIILVTESIKMGSGSVVKLHPDVSGRLTANIIRVNSGRVVFVTENIKKT